MVSKTKKSKSITDYIKKSSVGVNSTDTGSGKNRLDDYIADLTSFLVESATKNEDVKRVKETESGDKGGLKVSTVDIDKILYESGLEPIICKPTGLCSDGRRVGEVFRDKYGLLRQRGFLNTTRQTVYLDFMLEKAVVKQLLPNTFKIETERGSLAIVPEDFLCEMNYRYGVMLVNYDKCKERIINKNQ